jgi:hypothetical protein
MVEREAMDWITAGGGTSLDGLEINPMAEGLSGGIPTRGFCISAGEVHLTARIAAEP